MACSDNVVRAGLTIKHRDKDTLCQMLTYKTRTPQESKFLPQPHPSLPCVQIYDPPTPEFTVARIAVPKGSKEFVLPSVAGAGRAGDGVKLDLAAPNHKTSFVVGDDVEFLLGWVSH